MREDVAIAECEPTLSSDPVLIISSSGSTGKPKYTIRSQINVVSTSTFIKDTYGFKEGDMSAGFQAFGYSMYYQLCLFGVLINGGKVFLYNGSLKEDDLIKLPIQ